MATPPLDPLLAAPVRYSFLRHLSESPAHYVASILNPKAPTPAMRFGRIVHAVLLGGSSYAIWHGKARRGKKWDAFVAKHGPDKLLISEAEYKASLWCCDAIGATPHATPLFVGQREAEVFCTMLGRRCVMHLDVRGDGFVNELKTTSSAHPETFARACLRMGYHAQLAWYLDGCGMPDGRGFITGVETDPPYAVTVFELSKRCLLEGRKLYRFWLERLLVCEAANEWPGYAQSILPLDVPETFAPLIIDGEEVAA